MVHASDHHDALEVRRAGLLVVINSNCHALHGVRAEIAALKEVTDAEPPEARAHLAGHAGLLEKHRAMIEALVIESEGLRSEVKQWCIHPAIPHGMRQCFLRNPDAGYGAGPVAGASALSGS
jgi:hypothetical protein